MEKGAVTRRAFLAAATTTAAVAWAQEAPKPNTAEVVPGKKSPNEKLNIAAIGAGGKGLSDIMGCAKENVVALCDVDTTRAAEAMHNFPDAKFYQDFRKMLDEMGGGIDACTISTTDHMHAPAAYMAMKLGKHVYVQKPLTHTIAEARLLTKTAHETGVATQMGNQGRSYECLRQTAELIASGVIGPIREAHVWTNRPIWPQGVAEPYKEEPVPETIDWDLWIGCAPMRPYNHHYAPFKWRGWWDFGCGALGDMGCHCFNPAWAALNLAEATNFTVEVVKQRGITDQCAPKEAILKYVIPPRGLMPGLDLYWYDGGFLPKHPEGVPESEPLGEDHNGTLFIGENGAITCGCNGDSARLLPAERNKDLPVPPLSLPRVEKQDHYKNWLDACRGGAPACSNFDIAGPMTEMVNMGNVVLRAGKKIAWDAVRFEIVSDTSLNPLLTKEYRAGWEIPA